MRLSLCALLALAVLASCTPAVENVSYTLPSTPGGRMCVRQCMDAQEYCHQSCDIKKRECVMKVQSQAITDYDKYTREQFASSQPIDLMPSDFERMKPCDDDFHSCGKRCDRPYQVCYQDCGGTVSVTSSCLFFCF